MPQETCRECGSGDLAYGVKVCQSNETGHTGLQYRSGVIFSATERMLADLCKNCGTVQRFWVRRTDRPWQTKDA